MWRVWQAHLRRVLQVETVVKFEVNEPNKRSVELHKRQHHSEIYITGHLQRVREDRAIQSGTLTSQLFSTLKKYIVC